MLWMSRLSSKGKSKMQAKKRNLSFEMIRIFAMNLIVLSHVISRMPWNLQELSGYGGGAWR